MTSATEMPDGGDWKQEVHEYIDKQIESHNTVNQKQFRILRDGQLVIQEGIKNLLEVSATKEDIEAIRAETKKDVAGVLAASAEAHKEIIGRLKSIDARLDRLEGNSPDVEE